MTETLPMVATTNHDALLKLLAPRGWRASFDAAWTIECDAGAVSLHCVPDGTAVLMFRDPFNDAETEISMRVTSYGLVTRMAESVRNLVDLINFHRP